MVLPSGVLYILALFGQEFIDHSRKNSQYALHNKHWAGEKDPQTMRCYCQYGHIFYGQTAQPEINHASNIKYKTSGPARACALDI